MRDVAIIGAGELGRALAHVLARRDTVRAIRIIDEQGRMAEGAALDIEQAAPLESFATALSGASDLSSAAGAAIVVIAERADGGRWEGDEALTLLRRVAEVAGDAIVVLAGAGHRELVERGARELRLPRRRLIGSAPEAVSAAARAITGLEANASPRDVVLVVLGNPPRHMVLPWEEATIGGFAATRVLDEPARRRVSARLPALWPPGPYALAAAAAKVIDAIEERSRQVACCFVAPDNAARWRAAALPVKLGRSGVERVLVPELNAHDRVALDNALSVT